MPSRCAVPCCVVLCCVHISPVAAEYLLLEMHISLSPSSRCVRPSSRCIFLRGLGFILCPDDHCISPAVFRDVCVQRSNVTLVVVCIIESITLFGTVVLGEEYPPVLLLHTTTVPTLDIVHKFAAKLKIGDHDVIRISCGYNSRAFHMRGTTNQHKQISQPKTP